MNAFSEQIRELAEKRNQCFIDGKELETVFLDAKEQECMTRKQDSLQKRKGVIVKSTVDGMFLGQRKFETEHVVDYVLHFQHLIKQKDAFFLEENRQERRATFIDGKLERDIERIPPPLEKVETAVDRVWTNDREAQRFTYDRQAAVKYAERWWNDYNPQYKKFNDNCTNFISQCLRAGGVPMTGYPNRSKGWWYRSDNWSFSWSVAHSFRWQLSGATTGLRGQEMSAPEQLIPGDVICYDFDGDGRWQHTTIVVAKDKDGMPLVNAQTTNSRMRYWAYEDSTAWTPNIKYRFFKIID
uniref:amidase domain-containing protein n=1 Tax=Alkalihalobacterium bogoriense TaxID=246272 RepID=UPI00047869BD